MLLTSVGIQAQDLNAEMTALGNAWKAAYERGDAAALAAVYAERVELVNDDGSVSTATRAEVEADWAKTFAAQTGTIEFADDLVSTLLSDGKANTKGNFTQTMTDKETGESTTFKGRYEHQAVKVDGRWLLSRMKVTPQ
ncbi:MAG TPA: nuclear transport factor 2 family protein [Saprospiraceae bacterium]|nr:nuclear transport factor 2 family protein [Saprospiraceae bacterium]HMP25913.1 nuclear transport factor 2 family protein [Saprospiraceae bacterium]